MEDDNAGRPDWCHLVTSQETTEATITDPVLRLVVLRFRRRRRIFGGQ